MFIVFQAVGKCVPKPVQLNVKTDTPSSNHLGKSSKLLFSNIGKGRGGGGMALQLLTGEEV